MSENTVTNTIVEIAGNATAGALVATIRAAVNGAGKYAAYVAEFSVTRETVKDHAAALATLAYPSDKPVQKVDGKRTRYGNAVQAAGNGLRAALGKSESEAATTDWLVKIRKDADKAISEGVDAAAVLDTIKTWAAEVLG